MQWNKTRDDHDPSCPDDCSDSLIYNYRGHDGVMRHLVTESAPLPGMACPPEAAHTLVTHMFSVTGNVPGFHVFVTHDLLVTATASWSLGVPLGKDSWPWYL